ncbi:MAG: phosphoribosylanthranilate isomerase [Tepidisphaeraceae bacterium]|jgi:phosphoribosylanthranilate isomerase
MPRTRIKTCSICRPQDAELASSLGADALGMIFVPSSKRYLPLEEARQIIRVIPPYVTAVGVFVDAALGTVAQTVRALHLTCVQLHGHETPDFAAQLALLNVRVLKVLRVDAGLPQALGTWRAAHANELGPALAGIVLESAAPAPGGSGIENDWTAIAHFKSAGLFAGLPPLILAGGLDPQNVAAVVRLIRPFAVDVSSGIEEQLRCKSPEKMRDFIEAVRTADESAPLTTNN